MDFKNIKSFKFDKAQYFVGDGRGNELLLKVNYKDNKFDLEAKKTNGGGMKVLQNAVAIVAKDLLKRKHGVNFADK